MPTKPTTIRNTFATNAVYSSGPFANAAVRVPFANPADGIPPDSPILPENLADIIGHCSDYVEWLRQGSSAASVDAHVLETDSSGRVAVVDISHMIDAQTYWASEAHRSLRTHFAFPYADHTQNSNFTTDVYGRDVTLSGTASTGSWTVSAARSIVSASGALIAPPGQASSGSLLGGAAQAIATTDATQADSPALPYGFGGDGGVSGIGGDGSGGSPGTAARSILLLRTPPAWLMRGQLTPDVSGMRYVRGGAAGARAGRVDGATAGGSGGAGGGVIVLAAPVIDCGESLVLSANGSSGTTPSSGDGGGGGGGGGGAVFLFFDELVNADNLTVVVNGGNAGNGSGSGFPGLAGSPGHAYLFDLKQGVLTIL